MTQAEFFSQLRAQLAIMSEEDRRDVLYDYEEHIRMAMENGMTEEAAVESLGSPKVIAKELLADYFIHRAETDRSVSSVVRACLASISLGFFNLIFVLGPFIAAVSVVFALFVTSLTLMLSPLGALITLLLGQYEAGADLWMNVFALMAMVGLGILLFVASVYLAKWFAKMSLHYLRYNLRVIKGEK